MRLRLPVAASLLAFVASSTAATGNPASTWRFDVLLDNKPIGYHRFELDRQGDKRTLISQARFNVKLLLFI